MDFSLNPGIAKDALDGIMAELPVILPDDYVAFLLKSDGGEGWVGEHYLQFWKAGELRQLNIGYAAAECALFLIGSDGGLAAYAFDTSVVPYAVVETPFIGMGDPAVTVTVGRTFGDFLAKLDG